MNAMKSVHGIAALSFFSLLTVLTGCEASSDNGNGGTSSGGTTSSGGASSGGTSSGGTSSGGPEEPACVAPTGAGTIHKGSIDADEVWTAANGPHIVENDVSIRSGATLTIEPCAEVQVAKGKHIQVAYPGTPNKGALVAEGTAKRPIKISGRNGERWASLYVYAPGTARLAHVTLENGGGGDFEDGTSLNVLGDTEDGADPMVFVDHVTIRGSLGTGALIQRGATFMPGSKDLVVTGAGGYPVTLSEHALDALPTGTYTGNAKDEFLVDPEGGRFAGTGFLADATIHDRGIPYHVGRSANDGLRIGGRTDKKLVTVTIEPGVVMKFGKGGALKVQHFTTDEMSTASLRAIGTPAKPIVLTSYADAPAPGDWMGIWYGGIPQATNAIENVRIEYAGGDCGCVLLTCSAISEHEGAIIFTQPPPSAFVKNTKFVNIANHAITEGYQGSFVDFRPSNEFVGVAGCEQTRPRPDGQACSSPLPACD